MAEGLSPGRPAHIFISQCNIKCTSFPLRSAGTAGDWMLYQAYQAHSDIMVPVRAFAGMALKIGGRKAQRLGAAVGAQQSHRRL